MLDPERKEKISYAVIRTLYAKFSDFPEDATNNRNAPFHEAFLKAFEDKFSGKVSDIPFFISLSSWFHGLNTTLGQSFFERVSHILSNGSKEDFKGLKISPNQQTVISDTIADLKNAIQNPDLKRENNLIFKDDKPQSKNVPNFTVDCYFEDEETIVAIELKTVKPNSSVFKSEKEKFLSAKAGLKNSYPNKNIYYYLGFPFDPQSDTPTGADKVRFMSYSVDFKKYFAAEEVLLADSLWDFLSSDNDTMKQILEIINSIATPEFIKKYEYLIISENKTKETKKYRKQLEEWNLISESVLVDNEKKIIEKILNDKRLQRTYNQSIFKDGIYNVDRYHVLKRLIEN